MERVYDGRTDHLHQIGSFGGIYFRKHGPFAKGYVHAGHRHYQDHVTNVMSGSVRVRYRNSDDGEPFKSAVFIAPINFEVAASVYHEIISLEDGTAFQCLFWNEEAGDIPFAEEVPEHG